MSKAYAQKLEALEELRVAHRAITLGGNREIFAREEVLSEESRERCKLLNTQLSDEARQELVKSLAFDEERMLQRIIEVKPETEIVRLFHNTRVTPTRVVRFAEPMRVVRTLDGLRTEFGIQQRQREIPKWRTPEEVVPEPTIADLKKIVVRAERTLERDEELKKIRKEKELKKLELKQPAVANDIDFELMNLLNGLI